MRRKPPIGKRVHGVHVVYTAVTDFDDALDIIRRHQSKPREDKTSLRTEFALNAGRQRMRPVTLSDRIVPGKVRPPEKRSGDPVVWTREQIQAAWASKKFKIIDLARRGKCSVLQIKKWCFGPEWRPTISPWRCESCGHLHNPAGDMYCGACLKFWSDDLLE